MNSELVRLHRMDNILLKASVKGEKSPIKLQIENYLDEIEAMYQDQNIKEIDTCIESAKNENDINNNKTHQKIKKNAIVKSTLSKFLVEDEL